MIVSFVFPTWKSSNIDPISIAFDDFLHEEYLPDFYMCFSRVIAHVLAAYICVISIVYFSYQCVLFHDVLMSYGHFFWDPKL
jgi:hypothetical protein